MEGGTAAAKPSRAAPLLALTAAVAIAALGVSIAAMYRVQHAAQTYTCLTTAPSADAQAAVLGR